MKIRDPKTGFIFDLNTDPDLLEWIQEELAEIPEGELTRNQVLQAAVRVHSEMLCPLGDISRDRAYLELVVAHFCGWSLCAWCGVRLGETDGSPGISHGCCRTCMDGVVAGATKSVAASRLRDQAE